MAQIHENTSTALTTEREDKSDGQKASYSKDHWIRLSSVLRPRQHSIGYMGDGFYR